ncbi:protein translocase subunit secG [Litoreibacter ponti]|uniref:Protein-export membrane protein SecG n=1 Tax=Litoreibacter ponti TaxID=1510457 RepID=A0A2T6BK49_9RHOB|nr:preprotein translocase subunit SecG [Litoreibacter ponti]PTX56434.1 protein translocase subunit secG [Litoreibacter ponti]
MENIVLTVHLIIALCLILIVLIQRSEGGGLGIGGGGGGGAMTGRPAISPLGKLTWLFGIAFVITSITLTILAQGGPGSVVDDADLLPPAAVEAPAGDALLPPPAASGTAPLTPPRADE